LGECRQWVNLKLRNGFTGGVAPLALARGAAEEELFFMISKIRDKLRYSNLSNNMMISKL
jgi:hypothetical protein